MAKMSKFGVGIGKILGHTIATRHGYSQPTLKRIQEQLGITTKPTQAAILSGLAESYENIGEGLQEQSLRRRRNLRQVDLSMLSPGMLSVLLSTQRSRRRLARRSAVVGGLGLGQTRKKTLLGE